jgi:hypothetical protein
VEISPRGVIPNGDGEGKPMKRTLRRIGLGLSVLALGLATSVGVATASGAAVGHPSVGRAPASQYDWTLVVNFGGGSTGDYVLQPLIKKGKKLHGDVVPPNTECAGTISGTLVKGALSMKFAYPGTPCSADTATMTGTMKLKKGKAWGTFTNGFRCTAGCPFTGKET